RVTIDAAFAAGLGVKLNLVISKAQVTIDVLAGGEISDEHWLTMNKMKTRGAIFRRSLRRDWLVAGAGHLQTGGNDQRDVRGSAISGIVVEGKPARRIHQVRAFRSNISQPPGGQWSAFRRKQRAAPTKAKCERLVCRHNQPEIDPHAWPKRADTNFILDKSRQRLAAEVDAFHLQGPIEFED